MYMSSRNIRELWHVLSLPAVDRCWIDTMPSIPPCLLILQLCYEANIIQTCRIARRPVSIYDLQKARNELDRIGF
jgi:hypothetical protein